MFLFDQQQRSSSPVSMSVDPEAPHDEGKKRKRSSEQPDETLTHSLSVLAQDLYQQGLPTPPHSSFTTFAELPYIPNDTYSPTPTTNGETHAPKRVHIAPKTRRPRLLATRPSNQSAETISTTGSRSPCHRCRRQPSILSDLTAFTTCDVCGNTTCVVCMRQCGGQRCRRSSVPELGEAFHSRRVCAACCVEVGVDGRVWCLPCYHNHEDDAEERDQRAVGKNKKEIQSERVGMVAAWLNSCME